MKDSSGKQHFLLRTLAGVLTPEEINSLTTQYCSEKRINLTDLTAFELLGIPIPEKEKLASKKGAIDVSSNLEDSSQAKILPFNAAVDDEAEVEAGPIRAGEECAKVLAHKGNFASVEDLVESYVPDAEDGKAVVQEKKAASVFILEEKERLCQSRRKLEERQVMDTYKNVASITIERGKRDASKEDKKKKFTSYRQSGCLVNRKHS